MQKGGMHVPVDPLKGLSYIDRQAHYNRQYQQAWDDASEEFKRQASRIGVEVDPESYDGMTMEFQDGFLSSSTTPDMALLIDRKIDELIEKHGNAQIVLAVVEDLKRPMEAQIKLNRALLLGRVVGELVKCPRGNVMAMVHSLMHAIPRMAGANGYKSMRESATRCGVSVEWIRKVRVQWSEKLGIPIPIENQKSVAACKKYKEIADNHHWRKKKPSQKDLSRLLPTPIKISLPVSPDGVK